MFKSLTCGPASTVHASVQPGSTAKAANSASPPQPACPETFPACHRIFACADAGAHNAAAQPNALLCAFHPNTPLSGNTTHKKHQYPGSAASEFSASKASCLQVQDPGCLSLGLWEAHPHASTSHLPLMPAVAGAIPAVQSKC